MDVLRNGTLRTVRNAVLHWATGQGICDHKLLSWNVNYFVKVLHHSESQPLQTGRTLVQILNVHNRQLRLMIGFNLKGCVAAKKVTAKSFQWRLTRARRNEWALYGHLPEPEGVPLQYHAKKHLLTQS